jgi:hypothetical protein
LSRTDRHPQASYSSKSTQPFHFRPILAQMNVRLGRVGVESGPAALGPVHLQAGADRRSDLEEPRKFAKRHRRMHSGRRDGGLGYLLGIQAFQWGRIAFGRCIKGEVVGLLDRSSNCGGDPILSSPNTAPPSREASLGVTDHLSYKEAIVRSASPISCDGIDCLSKFWCEDLAILSTTARIRAIPCPAWPKRGFR